MDNRIYILGPCSAESREQVLSTAQAIQEACGGVPFIFRAGVWKPRTSPHTFQGAGEEALTWLQEVKQTYGIPVATEVATPEHVEAALKAGIDYLWIGARSSANPIVVQEIAKAIDRYAVRPQEEPADRAKTVSLIDRYADRPAAPVGIIIKNPVNADAALWLGNIERLEQTGVPVMAVHRGCGHKPCWSMAHAVRMARPDIPMLLDPSHMSGDAAQVPALMAKIAELGLEGAMIEVHHKPSEALSDAKQQITPDGLTASLIDRYAVRPQAEPADRAKTVSLIDRSADRLELNWLRAEIDEIDDALWETITARMDVSRRIGEWKKTNGVAPLQPERYQQIKSKVESQKSKAFSPEFALRIWELIHEESLKQQA